MPPYLAIKLYFSLLWNNWKGISFKLSLKWATVAHWTIIGLLGVWLSLYFLSNLQLPSFGFLERWKIFFAVVIGLFFCLKLSFLSKIYHSNLNVSKSFKFWFWVEGLLNPAGLVLMKYAISSLPIKTWEETDNNPLLSSFKTPFLKSAFPDISLSSSKKLLVISNLSFSYKAFSSLVFRAYKLFSKREQLSRQWAKYLSSQEKDKLLSSINLSLMSQRFVAIVGRNGSGKSTIAKIIVNLLSSYEGQVYWIGKNLQDISVKSFARNVAYIPQHSIMYQDISLVDFISIGFAPSEGLIGSKLSKEEKKRRIYTIIKELGLEKEAGKPLHSLSGGNRQKAIIARAIAQGTSIIVLDEPLNFLDIKSRLMVLDYLKFLQTNKGVTIIMIHHDIEQIREYLDEVVVIDQGFLEGHYSLSSGSELPF
mgnify:CR=1 FL=1